MKKLLLLGDSITDFGGYAALIETIIRIKKLDITVYNLGVSSENTSGLAETWHPFLPRPNIHNRLDRILEEVCPDIAVVLYGVNDGIYYPFEDYIFEAYQNGMYKLIERLNARKIKTIVCTPTYFDKFSCKSKLADTREDCEKGAIYQHYDDIMEKFSEFIRVNIAHKVDRIVDVHSAMKNDVEKRRKQQPKYISGDGIHPNFNGTAVIAETILNDGLDFSVDLENAIKYKTFLKLYNAINKRNLEEHYYLKEKIGHENLWKAKPKSKEDLEKFNIRILKKIDRLILKIPTRKKSKWEGYQSVKFDFGIHKATIVLPKVMRKGVNVVWKPEFLSAFTKVDKGLIDSGFALIYLDMPDMYGSPKGIALMEGFYRIIQTFFSFSKKFVFLALSRGALSAINYTAKFPKQVAVIYFDAPVFDIESWPLGKGNGKGSSEDVEKLKNVYLPISFEDARNEVFNALSKIGKAKIPTLIISNKEDDIVPFEENGAKIAEILEENTYVILKNEKGHHPHGLNDSNTICQWIIQNINKSENTNKTKNTKI